MITSNLICPRCGGTLLDRAVTGRAMRAKRVARNLSLEEVGDRMKLAGGQTATRAYVSALELGKCAWNPDLVRRYEAAIMEADNNKQKG